MSQPIDVRDWNKIVAEQPHSPFLQSYEWGEFQKSMGHGVERILFHSKKRLIAVVQLFAYALGGGFMYLYLPQGPVGTYGANVFDDWQKKIQEIQKRTKAIFLRWEPQMERSPFFLCRMKKKADSLQPRTTLVVPLDQTEDVLLNGMHPKTRYNIRLAGKHGVEIQTHDTLIPNIQNEFLSLLKETAQRDHFYLHQDSYYHKLLELFREKSTGDYQKPYTRLYTAWAKEQMLAGVIVLFFGDTATYLHGASSMKQKNVMAPHALHWHIIKEAKKFGYQYYDFWGIAETDNISHSWAGLTRFKKGFGGSVLSYPSASDCIFSPFLYTLYLYAKAARTAVRYLHP